MSGDINVQSFSGKVNISNNLLVGSSHLFVDTVNNRVGITTGSPGASLEVNGNVHVGTDLTLGGTLTGDGSGLTNVNSDSGLWAGAGTGSVYLSTSTDKVGIGTTSPSSQLELYGAGKDLTFKYDTGIIRQSVANRDAYYSGLENSIKRVGDRNIFDGSLFTPDTTHEILFGFSDTYTQWSGLDQYYPQYMEMRFKLWSPSSSTVGSLTDVMTLRGDGNVGIGVTSPSCTLDVRGSSTTSGIFSNRLWLTAIGDNSGNGTPDDNTGSPWYGLGYDNLAWNNQSYKYSGDIPILSGYNGVALRSGTGNLVLTSGGRVGIGTTNPGRKLDVVGGPTKSDGFILGTSNNVYYPGCIYTDFNWGMLFRSAISSPAIADFVFNDYAGSNMMVIKNGNVGIGTTTPGYKLDVSGNTMIRQTLNIQPPSSGGGQNVFTGFRTGDSYGRAQLVLSSGYSDVIIASSQVNNNHGSTLSFASYNPSNAADYRKFVIGQGNWGSRIHFLEFGYENSSQENPHGALNDTDTVLTMDGINKRVGIGTRTPSYKLDVQGDINSTGKLNIGDYAVGQGYMTSRTLTLGSTSSDYGGGSSWNTNTAAILLECLNNTEIAVHDGGTRVASLMHYEGSPNRITIGRDMGWGTISSVRMYGSQSYPNRPVAMVGKSNGRVYSPNVIVYNSVLYNDGGLYNTGNGRFTAPAGYAGYYLVTYTGLGGANETAPNTRWQLNGNDLAWGAAHINNSPCSSRWGLSTQLIVYLNAGDFLTHRVISHSIYGSASTHSTTVCMFMGSR
jgi:hypothetical protein